ncbi:hypothetical protein IT415_03525 [bacterium]|nr:hypothetical protein [bacterium]
MVLFDAISWWYSWAWLHVLEVAKIWLKRLYNVFSVRQMVRTLFAPWKEDRVTGAQGLDQMMSALVMNSVARLVGFSVRSIFLLMYAMLSAFVVLAGLFTAVAWPFIPLSPVLLLFLGVVL